MATTDLKKFIVWNPDYIYELDLAKRLNIDLFDDAELIDGVPTYNIKTDPRIKIVIKNWWCWHGTDATTNPKVDLSWADLVICYTGELINGPWDWYYKKTVEQFNNTNFITVSNGRYDLIDFPEDLVYDSIGHFFSKIADKCQFKECNISDSKPKIFEALFGKGKPHRRFVYNQLEQHNLLDKSFVHLHPGPDDFYYSSPDLADFDDPAIALHNRLENQTHIKDLENGISVSISIPLKIYQNSWYSIVGETNYCPVYSNFLTEKTAKPLFGKRLFVLFGAQGLLTRLHSLGYKTFHGIIDESYDQISDPQERWAAAFEQVLKLSTADHAKIYKQIEPILEHNHQHICDHHFRLNGLKTFLNRHLSKLNKETT